MDNNNESKAERFVRLAEPRVSRACKAISLIGHLAENDMHGKLSFIERALGINKARELYQQV